MKRHQFKPISEVQGHLCGVRVAPETYCAMPASAPVHQPEGRAMKNNIRTQSFTVTNDHLTLLRCAYVGWDDCEFGAPSIDCKRPYGNTDVYGDIAEILGWTLFEDADGDAHLSREQKELANRLHVETAIVLQIGLLLGKFEVGTYRKSDEYDERSWVKTA